MGPQRTSGIATVMFTDVESSTDMTTRLGDDAAAPLFAEHDRIVRSCVAAAGGRPIRSTGDGFLVLFDSARSAVECALAIQHELAARANGIRIRIGVHAGEVAEGDGELFGAAVNLAARVMERATGGEILVTDTTRQLAGTMPGARFRDRGRVALKGFPDRQRLYEVRPGDGRPRRRRARRRGPVAAVAAVAGALALTVALVSAGGGEEAMPVQANSVAILDAEDGRVTGQVPVGVRPTELAASAGSVWVANAADGTVTQISAESRRVTGTVAPGIGVDGLGAGPSGVWVTDNERSRARVIDPAFRSVARTLRIGGAGTFSQEAARPLAVTADAVWVTYGIAKVARVDPDTGRIVATIPVGNSPSGLAVGAGAVWVSDDVDGTVTRIDPRTNDIAATIPVGLSASGVAIGTGGVWVAVPGEDRVKRIDADSNAVADTVRVDGGPGAIAVGAGEVWVTSRRGGTVTSIDPAAARVTRIVPIGHSPQGIAIVGGNVWVAVQEGLAPAPAARIARTADVLHVLYPPDLFGGTDPALAVATPVTYATCAPLLNYPDEPFPAGAQLQPEVARALPAVSRDRRTYRFRVRPGFRFSPPSGAPVTAAAFRRAIERALHPRSQSYAPTFMSDIAGFDAYRTGRARRLAGVTARGDTLTIRLKAASATLPARLASSYFCAVPPTTPIAAAGIERIPTAGPYYIEAYVPKRRLVLERNPNYGGARPARMATIDVDLDVSDRSAAAVVEAGRADYATAVPVDRVSELARRYGPDSAAARAGGQRYFSGAGPVVHWFALNTRRPLFAGRRMRLAVNAALDRSALARSVHFYGGPAPGRPTDQFIPPGQPGFRDAPIHPLGGPDLERARRLAGGHRRRAVLYTCNLPHCLEHGRVTRRNLAAIGLDVEVENFPLDEMFTRLLRDGEPWDLGYFNYFMDFADPSHFIAAIFGPGRSGANAGRFRDPQILRRIRDSERLGEAARADAFAQLDADLARAGAAAPFATAVTTDFFSERIGCQVHQADLRHLARRAVRPRVN